jgi:hypothetical protein
MDLGLPLTIKAGTITISSGHSFSLKPATRTQPQLASGFFLEVFDRHEEDSPGMNRGK